MSERLRRVVVDGVPYRWRFDDVLVVIPGDRSGPQLYVDWGWRDWLEPDGPGAEPHVITPRFVAEAVRYAAAMGWPSAGGGRPLRLGFQGGSFSVAAPDAEPLSRPPDLNKNEHAGSG
ncbi:MAG TPA: hypothetical protein VG097_12735 [Gemmata sp.]|jgi:hypothetical protein|nr:hypothetical protein [Gemmata sp.]